LYTTDEADVTLSSGDVLLIVHRTFERESESVIGGN